MQLAVDEVLRSRVHGFGWGVEHEEPMDPKSVEMALNATFRELREQNDQARAEIDAKKQ